MSIDQRGDGWRVRVRINGTKYTETFPEKRIAEEWERKLRSRVACTGVGLPVAMTVGELWDSYEKLRLKDRAAIDHNTRSKKEYTYHKYIEPMRDRILRKDDIIDWLAKIDKAPGTKCQIFMTLQALYTFQRDERGINIDDPFQGIRRIKPVHVRPPRLLLKTEKEALMGAAKHDRDRALLDVAFNTGMRINEICQMEWNWIDRHQGTITVPSTVAKTDRGRVVPLLPKAEEALVSWEAKVAGSKEPWTLSGARRNYDQAWSKHRVFNLSKNSIQKIAGEIGARAGVRFHWHLARHYFCASLLRKNRPPKLVAKIMGHSVAMTMLVYNHLFPDAMDELRAAVGREID